ncbi:hypothetical protein HRbin36_02363 [bacterium HR36]|nr:hypothetical protein HRbin36_02363 [bacterium HR36]
MRLTNSSKMHKESRTWLVAGLGGCPRCMRWSLIMAAAAWLLFAIVVWHGSNDWLWMMSFCFALGTAIWWLAHWGAYVGKRCLAEGFLAQQERRPVACRAENEPSALAV